MSEEVFKFSYSLSQTAKKDEAEIMVYSEIVSCKRRADDPEVTATDFDKLLKEAKASGAKKLRLRVNSPGGHVDQAVAMKSMLNTSGFEEINVDIEGMCASAATFFVCVHNAHVRIAQGSEFMIHNPSAWCWGGADDFRRIAERMEKMQRDQHEMYAARTGQTEEQIKTWMDAETWFSAKEAVQYGFADEILDAAPIAACASQKALALMQQCYKKTPNSIGVQNHVSHAESPVANGSASEDTKSKQEMKNEMEMKDITMEQLMDGNPELFQQIRQQGVTEERERMQQIDTLTDEGFEEMAQEAKNNGTSAADFLKQVVSKRAEKKKNFMGARQTETAKAANVTGGQPADNDQAKQTEEIDQYAKEAAEMAKQAASVHGTMY